MKLLYTTALLIALVSCESIDLDTIGSILGETSYSCIGKESNVPFADGDGTAENPYKICSKSQFLELQNSISYLDMNFELEKNIDLSGENFVSLGDNTDRFDGVFNGKNNTIFNLNIDEPGIDYIGIFSALGVDAEVKNLKVYDATVVGGSYTGIIGGHIAGIIDNCHTSGTVTGSTRVGGVVGRFWRAAFSHPIVKKSSSSATINGSEFVGGIVGWIRGEIEDLKFTGTINHTGARIGGIVGAVDQGSVQRATVDADIVGSGNYIGGIVGIGGKGSLNSYLVKDSVFAGTVGTSNTASQGVGGIIGITIDGDIENSHSSGSLSGFDYVGGVAGYNGSGSNAANVLRCSSSMDISGRDYVGGISSYNYPTSIIENSFFKGTITANSFAAGVVAYADGNIINSYSQSSSLVTNAGGAVGGITAGTSVSTTQSFWDSEVSGQSTTFSDTTNEVTTDGHNSSTMKSRAHFVSAGWDETIWLLVDGQYPSLR